jgi:hypothetical protein
MLLRHSFIVIYVKAFILMVQSLRRIHYVHLYTWRISPCSPLVPFGSPFVSPLYPHSTYLAPSRCDRNRPPPSQVACKLTPLAPLHPIDPPHPNFQNPANPAPSNDDLGTILALGIQNKNRSPPTYGLVGHLHWLGGLLF